MVNYKVMSDLLLVATLGFLGSFGHCVGMCGPLAAAFSLSQTQTAAPTWRQRLYFHGLLTVGRVISYALVGAGIGALGSILVAGGQLAGVGSDLRRGLAIVTGSLLIWMGLIQINPHLLPRIPILHPVAGKLHQRFNSAIMALSLQKHQWTPALLGMVWGLIPCGFLYAAQIKAAESGSLWRGAATMVAFGLGTAPSMLGVGISITWMSAEQRSQLFRLGGWVMLLIGGLTLLRTGDTMTDITGHGSLVCLILALVARPISRLWAAPFHYRRMLGVSGFLLAAAHTLHMIQHTLDWNLDAIAFMLPNQQKGMWAGVISLMLMLPAACTSFDGMIKALGPWWRRIHLLTIPALILGVIHTLLLGSYYLGEWSVSWQQWFAVVVLSSLTLGALLIRLRWFWSLLSLERLYVSAFPSGAKSRSPANTGSTPDSSSKS
jgi:uncharacterized protein